MPYLITTTRQMLRHYEPGTVGIPNAHYPTVVSRRAVATLDEAQHAVLEGACRATGDPKARGAQWAAITESGGTVGPLPDGTVITVEQVGWSALMRDEHPEGAPTCGRILAAFNAAQV